MSRFGGRGAERLALASGLLALLPAAAAAQPKGTPCEDERLTGGSLGIGLFQCFGGGCSIYIEAGDRYEHRFSVEPRVWDLSSPASRSLKDGDALVAIDGALVTTREGGRRLANVRPGAAVTLRVRRGDEELEVRIVPVQSCSTSRLVVSTRTPPG